MPELSINIDIFARTGEEQAKNVLEWLHHFKEFKVVKPLESREEPVKNGIKWRGSGGNRECLNCRLTVENI